VNVVYAHEAPENTLLESIFLAGPSPRDSSHHDWRPEALRALKELGFGGDVFVPLPRDGEWLPNYDAQVEWELKYLERASCVVFWIPRDLNSLPAFTTNVEFGMYVDSGKVVLGFPVEAPKMKYLYYIAVKNNVPVSHTLEVTLAKAVRISRVLF